MLGLFLRAYILGVVRSYIRFYLGYLKVYIYNKLLNTNNIIINNLFAFIIKSIKSLNSKLFKYIQIILMRQVLVKI